jgi:hypothetical protein
MVSVYGFAPEEADKWSRYNFTAEDAMRWSFHSFSPRGAHDWKEQRFDPYTARQWYNAGIISAQEAVQWRIYRFEPEEANEWRRLDFSISDALKWSYYGFTSDQANHWRAAEFSDQFEASKFNDLYPGAPWRAREAKQEQIAQDELSEPSIPDDEIAKWEEAGFTADDARAWRAHAGIDDLDEAIQWHNVGFSPGDAYEYIYVGVHDANRAAKLRDKNISPEDIEDGWSHGMRDLPL